MWRPKMLGRRAVVPRRHKRTHEVQGRGIGLGRKWQGIKGFERQTCLSNSCLAR